MKVSKKKEKKAYNFKIKNPSPLARKQKALSFIKTTIDEGGFLISIKRVAKHLQVPIPDAFTTVKELANAGYVQIGKELRFGPKYGSNSVWITPGKDVTSFLKTSENKDAVEKTVPEYRDVFYESSDSE